MEQEKLSFKRHSSVSSLDNVKLHQFNSNTERVFSIGEKSMSSEQHLDVQYQICSLFLQKTGQNLRKNQLQLIYDSDNLIKSLTDKILVRGTQPQLSITNDTYFQHRDYEDTPHQLKKVFSRTRLQNKNPKSGLSMQNALKQIHQYCSKKTILLIENLIEEHKKLSEKFNELQRSQLTIRKKKEQFEQANQENLILKRKNAQLISSNINLQQQINKIKNKIKQITPNISQPVFSKSLITSLKNHLHQKEQFLKNKDIQIRAMDSKIIQVLSKHFNNPDICEKCCELMRKIKDSILKYKTYMEQQMDLTDAMYQKMVNKLDFEHKS